MLRNRGNKQQQNGLDGFNSLRLPPRLKGGAPNLVNGFSFLRIRAAVTGFYQLSGMCTPGSSAARSPPPPARPPARHLIGPLVLSSRRVVLTRSSVFWPCLSRLSVCPSAVPTRRRTCCPLFGRARARQGRSIAPRFLCLCAARRVSGHARLSSTAAPSTPDTYLSRTPGGGGGRRRRRRRRRFTPAITCTMRRPQIARYAEIGPISLVGRRLVSPMGSLPRGRSSEA